MNDRDNSERDVRLAKQLIVRYSVDFVRATWLLAVGRLVVGLAAFYAIWRSGATPSVIIVWGTVLYIYAAGIFAEVWSAIREVRRYLMSRSPEEHEP